jgi:hypothetical protein
MNNTDIMRNRNSAGGSIESVSHVQRSSFCLAPGDGPLLLQLRAESTEQVDRLERDKIPLRTDLLYTSLISGEGTHFSKNALTT